MRTRDTSVTSSKALRVLHRGRNSKRSAGASALHYVYFAVLQLTRRSILFLAILYLFPTILRSQIARDYYGRIAGVTVRQSGITTVSRSRLIILPLGREASVHISFDLLGDDEPTLVYRLRHCDDQGIPSELHASEAIGGSNEYEIRCEGLVQQEGMPYVRYSLELNTRHIDFKLSGRYALEVVSRDYPDEIFVTLPIFVSEEKTPLRLETQHLHPGIDRAREQAVGAVLSIGGLGVQPYNGELWINIHQNSSLILSHQRLAQPSIQSQQEWVFQHQSAAIFSSGNSYKYVEHRGRTAEGRAYEGSQRLDDILILDLPLARPMSETQYQHRQDERGAAIYPSERGYYHLLRFRLDMPRLERGRYILEGQAFEHLSLEERTLRFNASERIYELTLPLKEGYQEYKFVYLDGDAVLGSPLETSHREHSNAYTGLVYYKPMGARYTRLLGSSSL